MECGRPRPQRADVLVRSFLCAWPPRQTAGRGRPADADEDVRSPQNLNRNPAEKIVGLSFSFMPDTPDFGSYGTYFASTATPRL